MSKTSLDKSKIKFLLLEGVHQSAVEVLKAAGYTSIEYITSSLPEAQLKEKIADAHFIGIRSRTQLTEEMDLDGLLAARPKLVLVDELAHSNARSGRRWYPE